jgi:hypothetical protein
MTMPGFSADMSLFRSTGDVFLGAASSHLIDSHIIPQRVVITRVGGLYCVGVEDSGAGVSYSLGCYDACLGC